MRVQIKVGIEYGLWGGPLPEQLKRQGYRFKSKNAEEIITSANRYLSFLHIHSFLTDAEWRRALDKVHKRLQGEIESIEAEEQA